jgi:hypothetical protein
MEDKHFSFEDFREVIDNLKAEDIEFFIFGGFAYDGILEIFEEHADLDIGFFEKDKEKVRNSFRNLGYTIYRHGNKEDYRLGKCKVDVLFIEQKKGFKIIGGNLCVDHVSDEAFDEKNFVKINNLEFEIFPFEWFSLYEGQHYVPEKIAKTEKVGEKIKPFLRELRILKQVLIEKPENMDLVEVKE